jgi:hypothetical protein
MSIARHLRVVAPEERERQPRVLFCGHCGTSPAGAVPASRVCESCGLGIVLEADADAAPKPGDPFLVVDPSLNVCALSLEAEAFLGIAEPLAVNRPITEFLVPADAESPGPETLVAEILNAGRGGGPPLRTVLRPTGEYGVRLFARLASCGPHRSALLVLSDD